MKRGKRKFLRKKKTRLLQSHYFLLTKKRFLWIFFVVTFAVFVWWILFGGALSVQKISCEINRENCGPDIEAELFRLKGKSFLTFKKQELEKKLKNADPAILNVKISIILPNKLEVVIQKRKPVAILKYENSGKAVLVDGDGFVFAFTEPEDEWFPVVTIDYKTKLQIGEKLNNPSLISAIELIKVLQEQYLPFNKIQVSQEDILVELNDQTDAIFSQEGNLEKQVTSLQQILSQATIHTKPKRIDVRQKKPVVTFE